MGVRSASGAEADGASSDGGADASWTNRIECQFTELKDFALSNSDNRTHEDLQQAIELFLQWRNGERSIGRIRWEEFKRQHKAAG